MSDQRRLPFVQFEFAGTLGLEDGRYLARSREATGEPERVLVVRVVAAPEPPRRRLSRAKPRPSAAGAEPATVPLTTLTVITATPLGDADSAERWLARVRDDHELLTSARIIGALVTPPEVLQRDRLHVALQGNRS